MVDNRVIIKQPIQPRRTDYTQQNQERKTGKSSFKDIFTRKLKEQPEIKFSRHAQNRLVSRKIKVSEKELNRLKSGIEKAEDKGAKDSLIIVNGVAYVVSVENKTVITAIDNKNIKENVFTNIDSAVIM